LAQALADVTVTVNNRFLPLMFVSPGQINAQMFSDLPDGDYTIVVHRITQSDVTGPFTIHRDAPAFFTQLNPDGTSQVLALHADGSTVTVDNPGQTKEQLTLFGTGFGPYDHPLVDGFPVPAASVYGVVDPVSVLFGSKAVQPDSAVAAPGMVGITVVKVTVPSGVPASAPLDLSVSVNGTQSPTARLPIQ
jgi:uncharacterized protein (TIGR03437 family)